MTLSINFKLAPEAALKFFRGKGLKTSFAWQDMWQEEHDAAFTVAKMADVDLLRDVRSAVDKAIAEGTTLQQFKDEIKPRMVDAGWWGKAAMVDPGDDEVKLVQLGSPRRLRTIFRVNMQASYAAGAWEQIQETKAEAPYLMYDAVDDARVRPQHRAWDGTVLPVDDPWWRTHRPPNGWNCRCGTIQLNADQVKSMGLTVADRAPAVVTRSYTNPRTGEITRVPAGIDPGWAYNPGESRLENLRRSLQDKLQGFRDGA